MFEQIDWLYDIKNDMFPLDETCSKTYSVHMTRDNAEFGFSVVPFRLRENQYIEQSVTSQTYPILIVCKMYIYLFIYSYAVSDATQVNSDSFLM